MALLELSMVISAIVEMYVELITKKLKRREAVLRVLQKLKLDNQPPADDFDAIYLHTLIGYGVFMPEPVLKFFRNEFIREAFRKAFNESNFAILEKEAESVLEWNLET